MIYDIENIKVGRNRLIQGKLIFRRGQDSYIIDGEEYNLEGIRKLFDIKPEKKERVILADKPEPQPNKSEVKVDKNEKSNSTAVALVEAPSRILSYHVIDKEIDLVALKLAAIARKVLLYYTSVEIKNGKYYAVQPWFIDWECTPGNGKSFIKDASEKYRDCVVSCPFCKQEYSKLSTFVSHVVSNHSYVKDRKPKAESKQDDTEDDQVDQSGYKCPHCNKVLKSSSGRTNHIKTSHPDKL